MIPAILITVGIVMAIAGLAGVFWCIKFARKMQAGEIPEAELQGALTKLSAVNMASMGGAMLGLAILLVGLIIN